ncbi:N-acetylmuramoyl-L-alanine amidase [Paenibacillus filicis]|uniref:N-acetylmuramoyl-L-alanine amidase n=1 Tax=Paenibacillus gyeongsangnamensis TaxID=3388067 RepID=A0ABT4Q6H2_9BACL|nr:N-acetylmuramoyl-L-alanine amidase [Paenibacillus filicis]MCZ8512391.1 N-acetylmuramoyl-L-alanine amidase [Paenibacillus filicis]
MSVFRYPVNVDWIDGLPEIPFHDGVGAYTCVVMHYTDSPHDTAKGERNYEAGHYQDAFVHEFIDPKEIIQVANPDYIAYGAGHEINPYAIHLELCHADNQQDFDLSYDMWCERAAEYLFKNKLSVSKAQADGSGTLWSHYDVTHILGGTDHEDPIEYLAKWGKTWQDVIDTVSRYYDALVNGDIWKPEDNGGIIVSDNKTIDQWKVDALTWLKENKLITQDHEVDAQVTWAELGVVIQRLKEAK